MLFRQLSSAEIAADIRSAQHSVCFAAPRIQLQPAKAMAELANRIGPELITVCLDFGEHVLRMGFGDRGAVEILRDAGIVVEAAPGLRTGLVIIDRIGHVFTPTALLLETEVNRGDAPNAMRLSREQTDEALAKLSPAAKLIAIAMAKSEEERQTIRSGAVEIASSVVTDQMVAEVEGALKAAPPTPFDVARQVRVFNAYIQYVELSLTGAAIQRRRLEIPSSIQKIGGSKELEGRLRTTFDLIEKDGGLSSKSLEAQLNAIRNDFTRPLGRNRGRVVLKSAKPHLEKALTKFREELADYEAKLAEGLGKKLDESRSQIIAYYAELVLSDPPDAMLGRYSTIGPDQANHWLEGELARVFPRPEELVKRVRLDVRYMDVTLETLNSEDFLERIKEAFPAENWEKAHSEFLAAEEKARRQL